jgi:intein/homing endonuclease
VRIKFEKGKQKEIISSFKKFNNLTWKNFSNYLEVSFPALKEWYLEKCLLPLEIYEILDPDHEFEKFIVELKDEKWGQSIGGSISKGRIKAIKKPPLSKELSELIGVIFGDGNINVYVKGKNIATYSIRICGHIDHDFEFLTSFVSPLIKELFDITSRVYISKTANAFYIIVNSKEIVYFLNKIGLKSGNKIKNQSGVPYWIKKNDEFSKAFIRGLIDTDGSIFRMSKRDSNLLRISFKNHNLNLLKQVRDIFIKLGYHPSKIITGNTIFISRKSDIENFINEIGFHNPKHIKRLKQIAP